MESRSIDQRHLPTFRAEAKSPGSLHELAGYWIATRPDWLKVFVLGIEPGFIN